MLLRELSAPMRAEVEQHRHAQLLKDMLETKIFAFDENELTDDRLTMLRGLVELLQPAVFAPEDKILKRGSSGTDAYFIGSGIVRVINTSDEVVAIRREGDCIGEAALLYKKPRGADCVAQTYVEAYRLTREDYLKILNDHQELEQGFERLNSMRRTSFSGQGGADKRRCLSPAVASWDTVERGVETVHSLATACRSAFSPNARRASNETLLARAGSGRQVLTLSPDQGPDGVHQVTTGQADNTAQTRSSGSHSRPGSDAGGAQVGADGVHVAIRVTAEVTSAPAPSPGAHSLSKAFMQPFEC